MLHAGSKASQSKTEERLSWGTLLPALTPYLTPDLRHKLTKSQTGSAPNAPPPRGLLLDVLSHLQSQRYTLASYLPRHLVTQLLAVSDDNHPLAGRVQGSRLQGSLLFCDVSGFTALTEALTEGAGRLNGAYGGEGQMQGVEYLTTILNRYFIRMLEILAWSGGILLKFAGDAMLAYFPGQPQEGQAAWACRAALRMMQAMDAFSAIETPRGPTALQMKIGIATGIFHAVNVGTPQRMEYVILGETVIRTMAAEGHAGAGQVVLDTATQDAVPAAAVVRVAPGYAHIDGGIDVATDGFEIKVERQRRGSSMAAWMMGSDEIIQDIREARRQLQALGAYLPDELRSRLQAGEQQGARRDQPRGENRPTAVVFLNVMGFEAALDRAREAPAPLDYERAVYEALDDFFIEIHRIISHYGGIVSRIDPYRDGSKLLVLFGAPRAHEDDIERAVRAATAARQALETFHRGWAHRFRSYQRVLKTPPPIQLRTGITYGVTFAGEVGSPTRREYTVMGDDVNLAARLMTAAKPGQILATSTVQAALTSQLRASSLPPIRVKGKINPIPVYQIEGIADTALKPTRQRRQPLIGRDAELTRAIEVLSQAQKGAGRSLIVSGEAGIGKSHFAETLSQHAQERGARILMMRCTSFGRTPYSPWVHLFQGILEQYGDTAPSDSARSATLQVWLEELGITEAEDARPLYQLLGLPYQTGLSLTKTHARTQRPSETTRSRQARGSAPATGLFAHLSRAQPAPKSDEPPQAGGLWDLTAQRQHSATSTKNAQLWQHLEHQVAERERAGLFSVITQVITGLADKQPLVLTVENAHWMDAASRDLLHHVSESLTNQPILIVRVQRNQDNRMPSRPHEVHLSLPPLNLESSLKLVEHLLHDVVAPDKAGDVGRVMYEKSRGNPLVIEALSTWWRDHQESGLELSAGFRASNILYDLVISRLDALSPVERNVVRTASILGIDVDQELLYHLLTPDIVETTLASALDHLEEAGFLQRSATATEARWFFQQPLIREIVYESLSLATRRARHRAAAHYLETHSAKEITSMAERLADHHRRAHQWLPAARYDLMSGHKARRQHAYAQARSAYTSALTMTARYTGAPAQITPLFVQAHEALGDLELLEEKFEQAEDHYRTAHHTLDESDPQQAGEPGAAPKPATPDIARRLPPPAARLALKHALTLPAAGREADAQQMAHDVWQHGPDDYRTIAAVTLAWLYCRTGGPDTSRWIERAASMARQYQGQGSERLHALTDHLHPNCEEPIFIQGLFHALTATSQDDAATHLSCTMSIMSTERMHDDQQ